MKKIILIWKKMKHKMEKSNTTTKKAWKMQARFQKKGAPVAAVTQEKYGLLASCNGEIVEQQLE